jgi:hypothetical protein
MTGSKTVTHNVSGAEVTITANAYVDTIDLLITVDLSALDIDLPDHSPHQLMEYLNLSGYDIGPTNWWCKTHRKIRVRTGSQARRVIKSAITKIDDAVAGAIIKRKSRLAELDSVLD